MNFEKFKKQNFVPTSVILEELLTGIFYRESHNTWIYYLDDCDFETGTHFTVERQEESFDDFILRTLHRVILRENNLQKDAPDFWKEAAINYDILQSKWQ